MGPAGLAAAAHSNSPGGSHRFRRERMRRAAACGLPIQDGSGILIGAGPNTSEGTVAGVNVGVSCALISALSYWQLAQPQRELPLAATGGSAPSGDEISAVGCKKRGRSVLIKDRQPPFKRRRSCIIGRRRHRGRLPGYRAPPGRDRRAPVRRHAASTGRPRQATPPTYPLMYRVHEEGGERVFSVNTEFVGGAGA